MSKKTILISFASLTLVIVGLGVGLTLVSQPQIVENKAASSSGTTIFKMTPGTSTFHVGDTLILSGQLNTGNAQISTYQVVAYLSYTTATSPVLINATAVTPIEPALNCLTNTISLDSAAKKYTLVIACGIPFSFPSVPYTTSGSDKTVFTLAIQGSSPGILTFSFNNSSTLINSATDASDILAIPIGGSYTVTEASSGPTPTPTPTPQPSPTATAGTATPTPTPAPGTPNVCGGTCGSNSNCQAGLMCYAGFCRNPQCKETPNCICISYAYVTPAPIRTPRVPLAQVTPQPKITQSSVTPTPTFRPTPSVNPSIYNLDLESPTPTPVPAPGSQSLFTKIISFILRLFRIRF